MNTVHLSDSLFLPLKVMVTEIETKQQLVRTATVKAGGADENHETSNKVILQRNLELETFAPLGRPARRCSCEGMCSSNRTVSDSVRVMKAKVFSSQVKSHQCPSEVSIFDRLHSRKYKHFNNKYTTEVYL
jgi:hypothetical protein